jgi:putative oxidoreductase
METYATGLQTLGIGLLLARVVIGLLMAAHGAQKLFGWFGGYGLSATGAAFAQLGFRPGRAFAFMASFTEVASGLLVASGFLGPIGPALMISVMIVAAISVHWAQGLLTKNGMELPLLYAAAAFGLAMTGFGPYSLDAWLGIAGRWSSSFIWIVLALGIVGGIGNLALRGRTATPAKA